MLTAECKVYSKDKQLLYTRRLYDVNETCLSIGGSSCLSYVKNTLNKEANYFTLADIFPIKLKAEESKEKDDTLVEKGIFEGPKITRQAGKFTVEISDRALPNTTLIVKGKVCNIKV